MRNFTSKRDQADDKALIDAAEQTIEETNAHVSAEISSLEKSEDESLVPILDRMRDQTIAYANRNALVIAARFRQIRKAIIGLGIAVFLIGCLFGGLTVSVVQHNNSEASKLVRTEQATRFASDYASCINTNARSIATQKTLEQLIKVGFRQPSLIIQLGHEVAPLRDNEGNVFTEPLPNPIPKSWKKACAEYAYKEVTAVIPPAAQPPKLTTSTSSTSSN